MLDVLLGGTQTPNSFQDERQSDVEDRNLEVGYQ
jgi:hypothetical protein